MPRFKQPAPPPPPLTPKLKTPMKMTRKDSGNLSLVAAFDDLMRNSSVFHEGAEKQFLIFVKNAKDWQNKWRVAENERQRLKMLLNEREKELSARELKIKQAQQLVNREMKERERVENERDNLQRQWAQLQDIVNGPDGSSKINNETLEKIRRIQSPANSIQRVQRTPSAKRNYYAHQENMGALIEQSAESLLDASELSFDDSREDILEAPSCAGQVQKRRSSIKKTRRSHSMGGDKLVATASVTLRANGHAECDAKIIETPQLKELVKRKRESREYHKTPIMTPGVHRTTSNAGSVPHRPHRFQTKKKFGSTNCDVCQQRIKFQKEHYVCSDCGLACHLDCKRDIATSCILRGMTRTPTNKGGHYLADFAPIVPPMIPPTVEICIEEINKRGLKEAGLYRLSGSIKESENLEEKLTYGKGAIPDLSKHEIHTVTSALKKFLRSCKEPVIPLR